ncbi:UNVERIFIED_CONTAM: hypothetical protein Sradi_1481800 [Sesamum radiatum]|uniref:Retrotransposon Copia-like N-terminal domain-containing protein n=1 Tax=Sesamum radiatum TaxID=300843 RepID=A0AAW2UAH8_SESRA
MMLYSLSFVCLSLTWYQNLLIEALYISNLIWRWKEAMANLATSSKSQTDTETLHLQSSDHPRISLVSTQLGNNYLSWSKAMKIALSAKMKFGLINGKCSKPNEDADFEQWTRADCMVIS